MAGESVTPAFPLTAEQNQRRWELIRRRNRDGLDEAEAKELDDLQYLTRRWCREYDEASGARAYREGQRSALDDLARELERATAEGLADAD